MKTLILFFTAVACVLATPNSLFPELNVSPTNIYNYPYYSGYHSVAYNPLGRIGWTYPVYAVGVKSQYHNQDILGQASYGHVEPGQTHTAVQDVFGNKIGSFSYYNAEGKLIQTNYIADGAGYRVSSNDLPVAPVHHANLPADTPEVAAAKAAHLAALSDAKSRSRRDLSIIPSTIYPVSLSPYEYRYATYPQAYPTTITQPKVTSDGFLEDTPEVALAKANHLAEHAVARYNHYATAAIRWPSYYYPYIGFK